jgi:hypothetical protein
MNSPPSFFCWKSLSAFSIELRKPEHDNKQEQESEKQKPHHRQEKARQFRCLINVTGTMSKEFHAS